MIFLSFLAVFGQALAGASFPRAAAEDLGHVLAHSQEDRHHHHDDGNMHVDDLGEESFHVHLDGANPAALPTALTARPAPTLPQGPPGWELPTHPSPPIEGLLRPPKLAS